jgi:hypothetical protein
MTDAESRTTAAVAPAALKVCELVGRDSVVRVMATGEGTRYTLCTLDGSAVANDLDAAGLAKLRPDLDPAAMRADWGRGALMMLDTRE